MPLRVNDKLPEDIERLEKEILYLKEKCEEYEGIIKELKEKENRKDRLLTEAVKKLEKVSLELYGLLFDPD